jgi:hypothetical protein
MKYYLERHAAWIAGLCIFSLVSAFILAVILFSVKSSYTETLKRFDRPPTFDLPGPKAKISQRSIDEIDTLFSESPRVIGGWVSKLHYQKTENPIVHFWGRDRVITELMEKYDSVQKSGKGFSSEELDLMSPQSQRNSDEARNGMIKCGPLESTNLLTLAPGLAKRAKGVCRATIPPFSDDVNLAIVVVIDISGTENSAEVQDIRRMLLRQQIDIFNRDYQGRETWAREDLTLPAVK